MAVTLDELLYGIRQTESSGRYGVVNSIGAVGAYQVMKSNIPGWTKAALGRSLTWQQFRDSPSAQDRVARFVLGGYYKKYGAEGAAAMWFSGQPNPNSRASDGGNTVRQYVNKVLGNSTQGISGSQSTGRATKTSGTKGAEPMTPGETAESYGFVQGLMNSNPELKGLFDRAVKGQWTPEKFQASLRDTRWFKTHGQAERDFLVLQFGDPATAAQKLKQARLQVIQLGAQLGLKWDKSKDRIASAAAYSIVAKGWSQDQARYYLGQYIQFPQGGRGEAGDHLNDLHQYSYNMGIRNSDVWYNNAARTVARGMGSVDDFKNQIMKQAVTLFPGWKKQLEAGQTVADLASPYMQSMSSLLELPPGSVNLFSPVIKKALQYKDPKTGRNTTQPIWSFENSLRGDPRWKSTKNAQDSIMQAAHQVLSDFGVGY